MFGTYAGPDLAWNSTPELSNIEIDTINNFNLKTIQSKPRVLISRGGYSVNKSSLSNSMASSLGVRADLGLTKETKLVFIGGTVQILVQSRFEGTCEKVTDYVQHFLTWSSPYLCNTQGFKTFADPMQVSPCTPGREDTEIFEVSIAVPWSMEETWMTSNDGITLKGVDFTVGISP